MTPPFQGGGALNDTWTSIAWSRDGTVLFAVGNSGSNSFQYSLDNGINWSSHGPAGAFTSISPNSNGTYIIVGNVSGILTWSGNIGNWLLYTPTGPNFLPETIGSYFAACSSTGAIQFAADSYLPAVYTSYDYGNNWFLDSRFVQNPNAPSGSGFTCAASSSNGFVAIVLGYSTKLQTAINTPTPITTTSTYSISLDSNSITPGNLDSSVDGYNITPYRKGISGQSVFVWTTPTGPPQLYPQTGVYGEYSLFTNPSLASGWGLQENLYLSAFFVAQPGSTFYSITTIDVPERQTLNLATAFYTDPITDINYAVAYAPTFQDDLGPGNYTFFIASAPPPAIPARITINIPVYLTTYSYIQGINNGATLKIGWIPRSVYNYTLDDFTYNIYYRDNLATSVVGSSTGEIQNDGSPAIIGLQTVINSISSFVTTTLEIIPPPPVTDIIYVSTVDSLVIGWSNPPGVATANVYINDIPSPFNPIGEPFLYIPLTLNTDVNIGVASVVDNIQSVVTNIIARVDSPPDPIDFSASYVAETPTIVTLTWGPLPNVIGFYDITQTSPVFGESTEFQRVVPPNTGTQFPLPFAIDYMEFKIQSFSSVNSTLGSINSPTASISIPYPTDPSSFIAYYVQTAQSVVTLSWTPVTSANNYIITQTLPVPAPNTGTTVVPGSTLLYNIILPTAVSYMEFTLQTMRHGLYSPGTISGSVSIPNPSNPTNLTGTYNTASFVTLAWTKAVGATNHDVIQMSPAGSTYANIGNVSTYNAPIPFGTTTSITFRVKTVRNGLKSSGTNVTTNIPAPSDPTNLTGTYNISYATLAWTKAVGATNHNVIQYSPAGTTYSNIGNVSTYNAPIPFGTANSITFKVQTVRNGVLSPATTGVTTNIPVPPDPASVTGSYDPTEPTVVTLNWLSVEGANGYKIYQTYPILAPSPTYSVGNVLTYKPPIPSGTSPVRFVVQTLRNGLESPGVNGITIDIPNPSDPTNLTGTYNTTFVTLTWTKAVGATNHNVFQISPAGTTYNNIGDVSTYNAPIPSGTTGSITFAVQTVRYGLVSPLAVGVTTTIPTPPTPPSFSAELDTTTTMLLSWGSVPGTSPTYRLTNVTNGTSIDTTDIQRSVAIPIPGIPLVYRIANVVNGDVGGYRQLTITFRSVTYIANSSTPVVTFDVPDVWFFADATFIGGGGGGSSGTYRELLDPDVGGGIGGDGGFALWLSSGTTLWSPDTVETFNKKLRLIAGAGGGPNNNGSYSGLFVFLADGSIFDLIAVPGGPAAGGDNSRQEPYVTPVFNQSNAYIGTRPGNGGKSGSGGGQAFNSIGVGLGGGGSGGEYNTTGGNGGNGTARGAGGGGGGSTTIPTGTAGSGGSGAYGYALVTMRYITSTSP